MARVTPHISYFRTTQNLGRVPANMFQTRSTHIAAAQEIRTYLQHLALYTQTHTHTHTHTYTHTHTHTHPEHSVFPSLLRSAAPGSGGLRPAVARQKQQHPRDPGGPQLGVLALGLGLWVWSFRGRPGGLCGALE